MASFIYVVRTGLWDYPHVSLVCIASLCLNLLVFALVTPRRQKKSFYLHASSPTSVCSSLFLHVFVFVLLAQPSQHLIFSHGLLRCRPVSLYSDHHSIFESVCALKRSTYKVSYQTRALHLLRRAGLRTHECSYI